jgi:hypothetical protein
MLLIALDYAYSPPSEVVIAGDAKSETTSQMIRAVREGFRPHSLVVFVPSGSEGELVRILIPLVLDKQDLGGKTTAYVCENFSCQAPTTDVKEFNKLFVQEVAAAAQQLTASSEEVAASIANMGHIANQTANMSQQVAASTEEQIASSEEMSSSSQTLSGIAKDLQSLVGKFILK